MGSLGKERLHMFHQSGSTTYLANHFVTFNFNSLINLSIKLHSDVCKAIYTGRYHVYIRGLLPLQALQTSQSVELLWLIH